ncbi:hypothetical protein PQX77_006114 [Marasmius sp. AFHP31]|nr:hypothetical protein PQX77_006114 [Marasmius sp. AFHP31]
MNTYFPNAQGTIIGANANFQTVAGNSTTNIYNNPSLEREDRVTLHGRTVRKVINGDINFQRVLSSKIFSVNIKPDGASTSTESQVVKVKKMEQTAKIQGYRGKFTATSFEPVDEKDREQFKQIVKVVLEAAMCGRSALLKQVFAVAESENAMTLIAHDGGLPVGDLSIYSRGKGQLVYYYLDYALVDAIQALRADETLRFPVTIRWSDWSFNAKNLTWIYDLTSLCLNPPEESNLRPLFYPPLPPLCQETPRRLDTTEIAAHVEKSLGDVLFLIASVGNQRWIDDLSYYARHGLLTLGTVINCLKPEILAHLPSTPSPEWFCHSHNPDVKANLSSSGRVDFSFRKTGNVKVEFNFGWCIPEKDQLQCAFLCQSLHFGDDGDDVRDVVYIDQVGFSLEGTFPDNPTNCSTPAYLFVHPLPIDFINNLHCIHYPLPETLFYWSHDPQGRNAITEEDWERFGVPELSVKRWIGSFWKEEHYAFVREHLRSRSCNLDGKEYAHDHGHPELVFADPHDNVRLEELECSEFNRLEPGTSLSATSRRPFRPWRYLRNAIRDMKTRRQHKHEARRLTGPSSDS